MDTQNLLDRLAAVPERVARTVSGWGEAELHAAPSPGEWSAADILAHLRVVDDIWAPRWYAILVRDNPPLPGFDHLRWGEVAGYAHADFEASLRAFALRRAELVNTLKRLGPNEWTRVGTHEEAGPIVLFEALAGRVQHEEEHCQQLETLAPLVQRLADYRASYDRVAGEYAARIFDELKNKPLDRELLDRFARQVRGLGPVCDLGCGPGQVARYLNERGVNAFGLDLSPGMVEQARQLNPGLHFVQGNMLSLEAPDDSWGGIAAFYSIIHIPRDHVVAALREFRRVLQPGGRLLLAFHLGQEIRHLDEWWGQKVSVDFVFFERDEMEGYLQSAGFEIEDVIEREPYLDVEAQTRRAYIFAQKPVLDGETRHAEPHSGEASLRMARDASSPLRGSSA
jgi:SAM-dependent methyltransferase